MSHRAEFIALRRKQLDRIFRENSNLTKIERPSRGWIHEIRYVLGMTTAQLGARLGIGQWAAAKLEKSEQVNSVTLNTLIRTADALNCEFMYAFIPRQPLDSMVSQAAFNRAVSILGNVEHSMKLENQAREKESMKMEVEALRAVLIRKMSSEIWNSDED